MCGASRQKRTALQGGNLQGRNSPRCRLFTLRLQSPFQAMENPMWRMLIATLLVAGCAQLPPTPEDVQAKRFQSVPDKAVIYVVRRSMDSREGRGLTLDDRLTITTYPKSYYRWEVAP